MSKQQRLVFAGIAAVIAVVAVIVLAGGSSDDEPETVATTTTPAAAATGSPDGTAEATTTTEPTPEPTPEAIEIEVEGGKIKGGEATIDVKQGDRVKFTVKADKADHVHVHGYDVLRDVTPGQAASFDFKADIPGVFEVELEESHLQIARLRVKQ